MKIMNRIFTLLAAVVMCAAAMAQESHIGAGLADVARIAGETKSVEDSVPDVVPERPLWKQKLYYGYNFDIYYHHDSKDAKMENGWSISVTPEIGWKLKERVYMGMRLGGSYADTYTTYNYLNPLDGSKYEENMRVIRGSWEATPYVRYRLKTLFNDKVGIWLEAHLYTGMEFPEVKAGIAKGTEYEGLKYNLTYGAQVSPVITYQFNPKSTLQLFFSIISFGYSGTTRFYTNQPNEYTNDIIVFSGRLTNLLANQFTPGLYGLKFGVQKSF